MPPIRDKTVRFKGFYSGTEAQRIFDAVSKLGYTVEIL